jgi:hypothetical protein
MGNRKRTLRMRMRWITMRRMRAEVLEGTFS